MEQRKIELIKDIRKLTGTLYFEFQIGKHDGNHWNKESVFIFEEYVCFIEPIFQKHLNNYQHYSFTDVKKGDWEIIIKEFDELNSNIKKSKNFDELSSYFKFYFQHNYDSFRENFEKYKKDLVKMINEFVLWVRETLMNHSSISILGI